MRRAHDVGGAPGFGPIAIEKNEPVFHEEWEGRVFGMMTTIGHRTFPMRPAIESIDPATYLASSYYQKWLNALEIGFVQSGTFTDDELGNRVELHRANPGTPVSPNHDTGLTHAARENRYSQRSPKYDGDPVFSVGDSVLTRHIDPSGHTRIPRYAQGKHGTVHALRGVYDLLDLKVQDVRKPEPVYTVGFDARELWGDEAESSQRVYIDLWESYLLLPNQSDKTP
ncbi:MAG: nitrile hydratase subunit beta [Dehalococcoidia bacterium]|nr:nitrile hydratase subunit beta [Dehalococcoidia bacterium]